MDIWAFGVILHQLIIGDSPFGNGEKSLLQSVLVDKYDMPKTKRASDQCRDLLTRCFDKDCKQRITITEVINHPCFNFFKNQHEGKSERRKWEVVNKNGNIFEGEFENGFLSGCV